MIHIRNVLHGYTGFSASAFHAYFLVTLREVFFAGRWTEVTKNNATEWDNNVTDLTPVTSASVNSANPGRVVIPDGGMTGSEGKGLTLIDANNDENCGVYYIEAVISDTEVEVDGRTAPADGWVTASTGISARLFDWGLDDRLSSNTYVVMKCPTGNFEVWLNVQSTNYYMAALGYPDGYASNHPTYPDSTTNNVSQIQGSSADKRAFVNAVFDGNSAYIFWETDNGGWDVLYCGELENTDPNDTYPGFCLAKGDGLGAWYDYNFYMIDSDNPLTQWRFEPAYLSAGTDSASTLMAFERARLVKRKLQVVTPRVYCGQVGAGFYRGSMPIIKATHSDWEAWRPLNPDRTLWTITESGLVIPKDGPNDFRRLTL